MRVILVTMSDNDVRTFLEHERGITLITLDCALAKNDTQNILEEYIDNAIPDILITYRCPFILPSATFSRPRFGAFNIHPSLLPKYPGLNPWGDIFHNKEREGGVTLHRITENVDAGPIIYQATFPIVESDTIESARMKADYLASKLVERLIESFSRESRSPYGIP